MKTDDVILNAVAQALADAMNDGTDSLIEMTLTGPNGKDYGIAIAVAEKDSSDEHPVNRCEFCHETEDEHRDPETGLMIDCRKESQNERVHLECSKCWTTWGGPKNLIPRGCPICHEPAPTQQDDEVGGKK